MAIDPPAVRRAWFRLSLRLRLTLLTVLVFLVVQAVFSVARYWYFEKQIDASLQSRLAEQARSLISKLEKQQATPTADAFYRLVEAEPRSILVEDMLVSLYTPEGRLLASNCDPVVSFEKSNGTRAWQTGQPVHRRFDVRALRSPTGEYRPGRTVAVPWTTPDGQKRVLICATSDEFVVQLTREIGRNIWVSIPLSIPPVIICGWLIAGIAVRPILRLQQIATLLRPDSLADRIDIGSTATEVARLQDQLNDARRRLDEGYRAQEQYAANVAHEFKTPLAVLAANAELIRQAPDSAESAAERRRIIALAQEESLRLARLCDSLLLLARVRHGKSVADTTKPYLVNEWLMDCVQSNAAIAKSLQASVIPRLLDGDCIDAVVHGDRELLQIMLDNLLRNAVRFSADGQTVRIDANVTDGRLTIQVHDHGPGIPPDMLDAIFERFVQASHATPHSGRGAGIGLQIARGIAALHQADISATSDPGTGTTFSVAMPAFIEHREPADDDLDC